MLSPEAANPPCLSSTLADVLAVDGSRSPPLQPMPAVAFSSDDSVPMGDATARAEAVYDGLPLWGQPGFVDAADEALADARPGNAVVEPAAAVARVQRRRGVPALGVARIGGGVCDVFVHGVRKVGSGTVAEEADRFHLGSCMKAMLATVAAILIERGLLCWDTPLSALLPALGPSMHAEYRAVTVQQLSSHRSGMWRDLRVLDASLAVALASGQHAHGEARLMAVTHLLSQQPEHSPGSRFSYSNCGYTVLAFCLEQVAGKALAELMRDELFGPLGMSTAGFGCQADVEAEPPDQPWPHRWRQGVYEPVGGRGGQSGDLPSWRWGAGGAHCSLRDWGRFAQLHLDGFNGRRTPILPAAAFRKLHEAPPHDRYTCGGWVRLERGWAGGLVLHHGGSNTLNYCAAWLAPLRNEAFLGATNCMGGMAMRAVNDAIVAVLAPSTVEA